MKNLKHLFALATALILCALLAVPEAHAFPGPGYGPSRRPSPWSDVREREAQARRTSNDSLAPSGTSNPAELFKNLSGPLPTARPGEPSPSPWRDAEWDGLSLDQKQKKLLSILLAPESEHNLFVKTWACEEWLTITPQTEASPIAIELVLAPSTPLELKARLLPKINFDSALALQVPESSLPVLLELLKHVISLPKERHKTPAEYAAARLASWLVQNFWENPQFLLDVYFAVLFHAPSQFNEPDLTRDLKTYSVRPFSLEQLADLVKTTLFELPPSHLNGGILDVLADWLNDSRLLSAEIEHLLDHAFFSEAHEDRRPGAVGLLERLNPEVLSPTFREKIRRGTLWYQAEFAKSKVRVSCMDIIARWKNRN